MSKRSFTRCLSNHVLKLVTVLAVTISSVLSFFLSLDSATPPREDYVQVDYALQSRYKV